MNSSNQITSAPTPATAKFYDDKRSIDDVNISVRREAAALRLSHIQPPGSGANHVERFRFIKDTFNAELIEAYRRAQAIVVGLKTIYDINKPLPDIADIGFLSKLALWEREAYYELERRVMKTTSTTVAVAVRKGNDPNALPGLLTEPISTTSGPLVFSNSRFLQHFSTVQLRSLRLRA